MNEPTSKQYELLREIARGGMATVYLARVKGTGQEVVIKMLPRQFTHDTRFRGRFEREAKIMAQLQHPAIVPIYDYGQKNETPYLVMRHMAGGRLSDRIAQGALSVDEAVDILRPIAAALDYAHAQGIVHRDIKPGNILFDEQGNAHLTDFGIVQLAEATHSFTGSAVVGTAAYMSPEQVKGGQKIDGRSDIYALGIVLYEMLSGRAPYMGDTPTQQMMKHVLEPVPRIREVSPDAPPEVEAILMKALAKDPAERYATAGALVEALATRAAPAHVAVPTVYGQQPATAMQRDEYEPLPAGPAKRRQPLGYLAGIGGIVFLMLLLGGGGAAAYFMGLGPFAPAPTATTAATAVAEVTATETPAPTATEVAAVVTVETPTSLPTVTPLPTETNTPTPTPTDTPSPTPTDTPTYTPVPPTPTWTPVPPTPTWTPTWTPTPTNTPTPTPTPTNTPVRNSSITLIVYWDRDDNGRRGASDFIISAAVTLYQGDSCTGPVYDDDPAAFLGYKFTDLAAGDYCVLVDFDNNSGEVDCFLFARDGNKKSYQIAQNEDFEDLVFGFPYVCQ